MTWLRMVVIAVVGLVSACGSQVDNVDGSGGSAGGGDPPCPATGCTDPGWVACDVADEGDACEVVGEECGLDDECSWSTSVCGEDRRWHVDWYEDECCHDECCYRGGRDFCPPEAPFPSDSVTCDPCNQGQTCFYSIDVGCGPEQGVTFTCSEFLGNWIDDGSCEPPPDACKAHATSEECALDAACRWIVPDCAEDGNSFDAPGCFSKTDCILCAPGEYCTVVTFNACSDGEPCDLCAANANVCH